MTLHIYTLKPIYPRGKTSYSLWFLRYTHSHYCNVKGPFKVTPWHRTPKTIISLPSIKLPTHYSFWDIAQTRLKRSGSLRQCERSNQGHTMMLQAYILPMFTFYELPAPSWFPKYSLEKFFPPPNPLPSRPDAMGKNNTCTAFQG